MTVCGVILRDCVHSSHYDTTAVINMRLHNNLWHNAIHKAGTKLFDKKQKKNGMEPYHIK